LRIFDFEFFLSYGVTGKDLKCKFQQQGPESEKFKVLVQNDEGKKIFCRRKNECS
jgi:hypothetical protein